MTGTLADAWFGAFRDRDIAALERILADDFVHSSPFGEIKGKSAYLDLVKKNPGAFFDNEISVVDVFDGGDKFAVRYQVNNTPACDCIYTRDGRITKIHAYLHVGEKPRIPG